MMPNLYSIKTAGYNVIYVIPILRMKLVGKVIKKKKKPTDEITARK